MDTLKEEKVRTVANSGKIIAAKAQVALELFKEEIYIHPIKKGEQGGNSLKIHNITTENTDDFPSINLYPNPNNGNMEIEHNVPDDAKCVLSIYTIEGKQIVNYSLNPKNKHTFINDEGLFSDGMYYYTFTVNDKIIVREKLVIIK